MIVYKYKIIYFYKLYDFQKMRTKVIVVCYNNLQHHLQVSSNKSVSISCIHLTIKRFNISL